MEFYSKFGQICLSVLITQTLFLLTLILQPPDLSALRQFLVSPVLQLCLAEGRTSAADPCPQGDVLEDANDYSVHKTPKSN